MSPRQPSLTNYVDIDDAESARTHTHTCTRMFSVKDESEVITFHQQRV